MRTIRILLRWFKVKYDLEEYLGHREANIRWLR